MGKDDDEKFYFSDLFKEAITDDTMSTGGRLWAGFTGLIGAITIDPIKRAMDALGIEDSNPGPDPGDMTDPRNS